MAMCPATARAQSAAAARSAAPDFAGVAAADLRAAAVVGPVAARAGRRNSCAVLFVDEVICPLVVSV
ncbi:MAG TPA: hypothetical protein VN870_05305, partial [Streptosporangiaceae bacterium]|nr:hypothetical protein [Streptosporangiaceae bacterium]